jgi:DedD protein
VESEAGTRTIETASVPAVPAKAALVAPASRPAAVVSSVVSAVKAATPADSKPAEKPVEKPADKSADKSTDKVVPRDNDGAKAQALLEGKTAEQSALVPAAARFVVQIGAYSEAAKAQEARLKLEKAGLKTYTQVVQPKEGKRIRVRVGPFESKAAADKVAEKIRKMDLPASILEL